MQRHVFHLLAAILLVGLMFGSTNSGLASEDARDLVRIDVRPADDLSKLAAVGLDVYTRLYTEDGGLVLIVGADARQQERLKRLGYTPVILERGADRSEFYLLYGLPEDLHQAGTQVPLLAMEGRQAVAALSQAQMKWLESLGVAYNPLNPQPFVYREDPQATTQALPDSALPDPLVQEMIDQVSSKCHIELCGRDERRMAHHHRGLPVYAIHPLFVCEHLHTESHALRVRAFCRDGTAGWIPHL